MNSLLRLISFNAETLAMKGLIVYDSSKKEDSPKEKVPKEKVEEARDLINQGLRNNIKSSICKFQTTLSNLHQRFLHTDELKCD